jgi:hypothetical protein
MKKLLADIDPKKKKVGTGLRGKQPRSLVEAPK